VNDGLETEVRERTRSLTNALEERTVLLHEVDHRVKNNLQLISSLIKMQARRIADPEIQRSLAAMLERISALSTVHRRLYQAEDATEFDVAEFIRDLSSDLIGAAGRDDIRLRLDLEPKAVEMLRSLLPDLALVGVHLLDGPTGLDVVRFRQRKDPDRRAFHDR